MTKLMDRYDALCHAMESGVDRKMTLEQDETSPKDLRVGVNTAMADHTALVLLLMRKGLITQAEYEQAMCDAMQEEVERYEVWINRRLGVTNITLP